MRRTILVMLVACLVPALSLAAREPDPKRFEKEIARFEAQDHAKAPPEKAVLFTGSSSIALWRDVGKYFPEQAVINRGFGGSTLPEVNYFLDRIVLPYRPRVVVLFCGGNDMAQFERTPEQVLADFRTFCKRVHAKLPETRIIYLSIHTPPGRVAQAANIDKANALVASACAADKQLAYVNVHDLMLGADGQPNPTLYADRLHPNAKAYQRWAEKLRPSIR